MNIAFYLEESVVLRAIICASLLVIATAPIGIFLILRRMSLSGDSLGHAVLPGASLGALFTGGASWGISFGAAIVGSLVFAIASKMQKYLKLQEDANFAIFYLSSLSLGILISDYSHDHEVLEKILFGNLFKIDNFTIILSLIAAIISITSMALIYKKLLLETLDPEFYQQAYNSDHIKHIFYVLFAIVSIVAFQAMGTLLALGIILLPAITSKYWINNIKQQIFIAALIGIFGAIIGILIAYLNNITPSAAIVITYITLILLSITTKRLINIK